jgi:hypothetical protein
MRKKSLVSLLILFSITFSFSADCQSQIRSNIQSDKKKRILLRSSWQTINIGDIAHTPGVLALLERYLPQIDLGQFLSPPQYTGEWRCDLHPRFSPDGKKVIIDSTHEWIGRQMYLIDIKDVLSL